MAKIYALIELGSYDLVDLALTFKQIKLCTQVSFSGISKGLVTRNQRTVETDFIRRNCSAEDKDCPIGRITFPLPFSGFQKLHSIFLTCRRQNGHKVLVRRSIGLTRCRIAKNLRPRRGHIGGTRLWISALSTIFSRFGSVRFLHTKSGNRFWTKF